MNACSFPLTVHTLSCKNQSFLLSKGIPKPAFSTSFGLAAKGMFPLRTSVPAHNVTSTAQLLSMLSTGEAYRKGDLARDVYPQLDVSSFLLRVSRKPTC
jgi:hypothetical protein